MLVELPWPWAGHSRAHRVFAARVAQQVPHRLSTRIPPGAEHHMAARVLKHRINTLCGKISPERLEQREHLTRSVSSRRRNN